MDDKQRHQVAMGVGIALGLASIFAPVAFPSMPKPLAHVGLLLSAGFLFWGVWPLLHNIPNRAGAAQNAMISLAEAAQLTYESVERQLLGRVARESPRGPLAFMAEKVFHEVPVVLGKQQPSSRLLPITEVAGRAFRFSEDGGSLLDRQTPVFTDLCINRHDFDAALRSIKASADGESRGSWDPDELVPLREAVGIALTATRDSKLAAFNAGAGSDEEEIVFGYFSAMLNRKTPIYGKTPPATDWVRLGRVDLSNETLWEMKSIKPHHRPVRMTDLSVRRGDLTAFAEAVIAEG